MAAYQNIQANCAERFCGKSFIITAGEQEFFNLKGFALPKRCKDCRRKNKERAQQHQHDEN